MNKLAADDAIFQIQSHMPRNDALAWALGSHGIDDWTTRLISCWSVVETESPEDGSFLFHLSPHPGDYYILLIAPVDGAWPWTVFHTADGSYRYYPSPEDAQEALEEEYGGGKDREEDRMERQDGRDRTGGSHRAT